MGFPTTQWTPLANASQSGSTSACAALDRLCRQYDEPVRAFLRSRGYAEADADDLTQQFFVELLDSRAWQRADQGRGRFRSFLLGILIHVISRERMRNGAEKRGGDLRELRLDDAARLGCEPTHVPPDSAVFDREWALQIMDLAMAATEQAVNADGNGERWQVLARFLPGAGEPPSYEDAARDLGLTMPALKTAVHRVRQRLREDLRATVARTVGAMHEIDDEIAYLHRILAAPGG